MKKKNYLWSLLTMIIVGMLSVSIVSCGGDDSDGPSGGGGGSVNPGGSTADPAGTVTLAMRNYDNGRTYLDNIYIRNENFQGAMFVSLGAVKGLGNVSTIPTVGWANQVAVVPGYGYVAYDNSKGQFYRIYVVDEIGGTSGGVLGADIKYQKPFKGSDETISIDEKALSFSSNGGGQSIVFNNKNIILFDVTSDQSWCKVYKSSTYDNYFLYNAVTISVDPSSSTSEESAIVTLTTAYKRTTSIKVTRAGASPMIEIDEQEHEITPSEQTFKIGFSSNLEMSNLKVEGGNSWLTAKIIDGSSSMKVKANRVKYIGNKVRNQVSADNNSAKSYYLEMTAKSNYNQSNRQATITVKSNDGKVSKTFVVKQQCATLSTSNKELSISAKAQSPSFSFTTNLSQADLQVVSNASWLTINSFTNQTVTYSASANDTGKDRKAEITITPKEGNLKLTVAVTQAASKMSLSKAALYFDRNNGNQTITVTEDLNKWEVESSSATWCTYTTNGNALTIRVTAATQDRQATIKFKNRSEVIKVYQSKYAVGDTYSENGVTGTVGYMQDGLNYIYKDVGMAVWSTENVATGATDQNDGRNNMSIIKKIANWKELYPAFALCDALNTNGVTGWYLSAYKEPPGQEGSSNTWSSTEYNSNLVYFKGVTHSYYNPHCLNKNQKFDVVAVHRF